MMTLQEIDARQGRSIRLGLAGAIAEAIAEGYSLQDALQYFRTAGYTEAYIQETLNTLRRCSIIAPWEPDS